MKVYKVEFNRSFQNFNPVDSSLWAKKVLWFDGTRRERVWQPLDVYVLHPLNPRPDIFALANGSGEMILTTDAANKLQYPLLMSGELLPVRHEGQALLLFNSTEVINCLDKKKTEFRRKTKDGRGIGPVKYAFYPNRFTTPVFKIPEQVNSALFALEWSLDPQKELKAAVEHHKLKGIRFDLVWENSGEASGCARD